MSVSVERRQQILAYLNANGPRNRKEIAAALGLTRNPTVICLRELRKRGEIVAKEPIEGRASVPYYEALVLATCEFAPISPAIRRGPGHYVHSEHRDTNKEPPYPHQGGQGGITNPRTSTHLEKAA